MTTFPTTLARQVVGKATWGEVLSGLDDRRVAAKALALSRTLGESGSWMEQLMVKRPSAVTAAATPHDPDLPPAAFFSNPNLTEPTPLTVTAAGHVYGHLAVWGTCHLSHAAGGKCVTPPHSPSGYAYFHTGSVLTAEGAEIPVGHITLDTRHATDDLSPQATLAHYDHTGTQVVDVVAGEDSHGIWVSGALRPGVSPRTVRTLRASPLSGDWRRIGTGLELVAALSVNVPGFAVPRPSGMVASGAMTSLVAAGMLPPRRVRRPGTPDALSLDDLRYLKRLAQRERAEAEEAKVQTLSNAATVAASLRSAEALNKARDMARRLQRARIEEMAARMRGM